MMQFDSEELHQRMLIVHCHWMWTLLALLVWGEIVPGTGDHQREVQCHLHPDM